MQITVTGQQLDVGESLRTHAEATLAGVVDKYFGRAIEASIVFSRESRVMIRADISIHVHRGLTLRGHAVAAEAYAAFDAASERLATRLRRHKRRIREDHHAHPSRNDAVITAARQYVLSGEMDEAVDEAHDAPTVIAEMKMEIELLTVSQAVARLDLSDLPALLFRNGGHGGFNMIYRRPDGNIGWVDPGHIRN
ncbi:MAG: ribosome hibernation-promoting factor, HPF/YfiA family [Alphaproteobacteria bacterium]